VISLAWILSYWIRFNSGLIEADKGIPPFTDYLRLTLFVWIIWAYVFRRFDLYRPKRGNSRFTEIFDLVRANAFGLLILVAATYLFREKVVPFSRLVFFVFFVLSVVLTIISRTLVRQILSGLRKRGYNLRFVAIVGAGELAREVASRVLSNPEFGYELVGCFSSEAESDEDIIVQSEYSRYLPVPRFRADSQLRTIRIKVIGNYSDLPKYVESGKIDQVLIALPLCDHDKLPNIVSIVSDGLMDVRIVPDVHRFIQLGSSVEDLDGLPVVHLASTPLSGVNRIAKRVVDLFLGLAFFTLLSPLLLLIALLVKLTSSGPVFYRQERVGLDGLKFNILKFRSMRLDAECNGAKFAVKGDARVTPIGRFLRGTSLDELPQLINVIFGEMSLVGPRPERPVFIDEFKQRIPKYMFRHKVQAGMTGWAQVNGWRGDTSIEKRIEHDLYYIENWSVFLDIKIILLTLIKGLKNRNAY